MKLKFPELKPLNEIILMKFNSKSLTQNEIISILKMYENHLQYPYEISSPSFYVSGALLILVSLLFVNSQHVQNPDVKLIGSLTGEVSASSETANLPQKMIMMTMISCSVCGLMYISLKETFPLAVSGKNSGCYYISNAMLSGVIAVSPAGESIEIWQAIIISMFGCLLYTFGSVLLQRFEIDDPVEASLIYGL